MKGSVEPIVTSGENVPHIEVQSSRRIVGTKIVADAPSVDSLGNTFEWVPNYETAGAANVDLRVNLGVGKTLVLPHRGCYKVDCGFRMQLPDGFKAEVSVRSGWGKRGLVVLNAPGQVDADYRGRIMILLCNVGHETLVLNHGDRVAQMWPAPVYRFEWERVGELDETDRGEGGFGSTGVN